MPPATVYRFTVWDQIIGDNVLAPRFATLQAIGRVRGGPLTETMRLVNDGDLDDDGFYPKAKTWLVEIVLRQDGSTRRSVPLGEYTMHEDVTGQFALTAVNLLPMPFQLTLSEVEIYLQGRMKILAGKWP
jgi:hypothetical protein